MDVDRHRFDPEDCVVEANCGCGDATESDRAGIETLGGAGVNGDGDLAEGSDEVQRESFDNNWGLLGMSGCETERRSMSRSRSRSPERNELSIWRSDDEVKDYCDLSPVNVTPLAAVVPSDVIMVTEEPCFRVGVGLTNLGNTCFLNSVLQCLMRTAPLTQGLCTIDHYSPCLDEGFCLICFLRELVHHIFTSYYPISPCGIATNLRYFSPDFVHHQQEDAHEFLQCLLDKLEKYQMFPSSPFSAIPGTNLVKHVFGGSLVSRLQCSECNHVSCTPEDLIDFSLEIDDANTLEDALDSFTKLEKIEDIKLTCDGCNEKVLMEKQFVVDQVPLVASFHLKRFKNDGITVEKIGKLIEYPLSLNLHPYTVGYPEHMADFIYDLYAVIVHDGFSSDSGHYYSFVRTSPSSWHEFDDSKVNIVSESHVLSREAYILFYAKRGTSWFSHYRDHQSLCQSVAPKYSPNSVLERANQSSDSDSSPKNLNKGDVQMNRHKQFSEDTYKPAFIGPQFVSFEGQLITNRPGEYSNLPDKHVDDDKNDVDMEDSSFNFDMLMGDEDKENITEADATIISFLNFDLCKDDPNNDRNKLEDKSGSSCDYEKMKATEVQTCDVSSLIDGVCAAYPSEYEATNFKNKIATSPCDEPKKSPNCIAGSNGSPGVTKRKTISIEVNMTTPTSCPSGSSHSPGATKATKPIQRKRSIETPADDARKKQVLRRVTGMNMPMTRAKKLLAAMNRSPHKKNKSHKLSRKNPNRAAPPNFPLKS